RGRNSSMRNLLGIVFAVVVTSACGNSTTSPSNLPGVPSTGSVGSGTSSGTSPRPSSVMSPVDATHNCNPPAVGDVVFSPTELGKVTVHNDSTCTNDFSLVVFDATKSEDLNDQILVAMFSSTLAPGATGILTVGFPEQCGRRY